MKEKINPYKEAVLKLYSVKDSSLADLEKIKKQIAKEFRISTPTNADLLKAYHNLVVNKRIRENKNMEMLLIKRKIRSLSGIVIVSVLTKNYRCPGKCIYCPSQAGIPKSYINTEPAVMRAVKNDFNPYKQVVSRIKALEANGHPTDKIDLRIIGGTWSYYPKKYQKWFILRCFEAANYYGQKNNTAKLLKREQKKNEKAKHRIIGITIETRPDYIDEKEIAFLRELGVTRVELGVQSTFDDVLDFNHRGHHIDATIKATALLKDSGFKICYQMMPNLPGSDIKKDKKMFDDIFYNPDFRPDMIKIYPCAILKEAELYNLWKENKYQPYKEQELIDLIIYIKQKTPHYVRIQRIIRDIPAQNIEAGPAKVSNMRQIVKTDSIKNGWKCNCIRCREVGANYNPKEKLKLFREIYDASGGKEIFLSYESKDRVRLYSLIRIRLPGKYTPKFLKDTLLIREIHTYGQLNPIKKGETISPQHKGLGKKMMIEAEKIAKRYRYRKIAVISGIGVRDYYKKLGYKLQKTYMIKTI